MEFITFETWTYYHLTNDLDKITNLTFRMDFVWICFSKNEPLNAFTLSRCLMHL
jgi:hypothetical protein